MVGRRHSAPEIQHLTSLQAHRPRRAKHSLEEDYEPRTTRRVTRADKHMFDVDADDASRSKRLGGVIEAVVDCVTQVGVFHSPLSCFGHWLAR